MAASDAKPFPLKNVAYRLTFKLRKTDGSFLTGATGLDGEVSKDGGAFANTTNAVTEIAQGSYYVDLTSTEMNADTVDFVCKTTSTDAIPASVILNPMSDGDIPQLQATYDYIDLLYNYIADIEALILGPMFTLVDDNLDATISSRATPAQVNTEVVDALATDTYGIPPQQAPPDTFSLALVLRYLYAVCFMLRKQGTSLIEIMAADSTTVIAKASLSDDGATFTKGKFVSGP